MPSSRKPRATPPNPKKKAPPAVRIHPDRRTSTAGLNQLAAIINGELPEKNPVSYYTPELIQCTLPHSDPKERDWIRTSGGHTLIVSSGIDKTGKPFGVPYGSFPRLVLAYIITHVVKNKDTAYAKEEDQRRIVFKSFFRSFLKEVGYTVRPSVRHAKTLHNGLERLLYATITYDYEGQNEHTRGRLRTKFDVAPKSVIFWNFRSPDQGGLWDSYIELSKDFRDSILEAPVPLRTEMLAALKKSPLALDLYMWLSYRLYTIQRNNQESLPLSYGSLQTQFGTGISSDNYRSFRRELRLAFDKVKEQWEKLSAADGKPSTVHCEMGETGLTLYRGPLLISPTEEKSTALKSAKAQAILTARKFDTATLRKARQLAQGWDVEALAQRYFVWLGERHIAPENPEAHFLDFVRSHTTRNN